MTTTDETIYTPEEVNGNEQTTQQHTSASAWKTVSIGGVGGILIGAAAMYAAESQAAGEEAETPETVDGLNTTEGLPVAVVDQNLSFGDAFAQARDQVGAGGVFVWHGNVYGTFSASEWANMSAAERQDYAEHAQPYIDVVAQATQGQPSHQEVAHEEKIASDHATHNDGYHAAAQHTANHAAHHSEHHPSEGQPAVHTAGQQEPEVHFLGMETVQTDNGQNMNVGHMSVNDVHVALVDVDDDRVYDVRVADFNGNERIEEEEVADISDAGITVDDFAAAVQAEQAENPVAEQVSAPQEDLAPEMPDYMNDAGLENA